MRAQPKPLDDRRLAILERMADGRLHTAKQIAATMGVSIRTIYRDIQSITADGAPIVGEAGAGYMLRQRAGHDG
jgi:predicted DNA-binding transcriptional regulator YafY